MLSKASYTHSLLEIIKRHFSHFVSICSLAYRNQTKLIILCYRNLEALIYYFFVLKTTALEGKKTQQIQVEVLFIYSTSDKRNVLIWSPIKLWAPKTLFITVGQKTTYSKITLISVAKSGLSFSSFILFLITSSSYPHFYHIYWRRPLST